MSTLVCAAFLALAFSVRVFATAFAVIRTPTFIVIAADSKAVDGQGQAKPDLECKIRKAGRFFYIANNFVRDDLAGYDLREIASRVSAESMETLVSNLKNAIITPLTKALVRARTTDLSAFMETFSTRQPLGVVFAGIEQGEPVMIDLRFMIRDLKANTIALDVDEHRCPGKDCPSTYANVFVSSNPELKARFEREHPNYWLGSAEAVAANAEIFVDMAITDTPSNVGPPISLLIIDRPQGTWRTRGICKE